MCAINKEQINLIILQASDRFAMRLGLEEGALYVSVVQRDKERHVFKYVRTQGESAEFPVFSECLVAIQLTLAKFHPRDI